MRRPYLLIASLLFITGIFAAIVLIRAPVRRVTLADGTRVELLGTTVGNDTFTTERPWKRMLRRAAPPRLIQWLPPDVSGSCSTGTNSITVFVRVVDPNGAPINSTPWSRYVAEDQTGFRYEAEGGYGSFGPGAGSQVYGLSLVAFPRRDPNFLLQLLDQKGQAMAHLNVPNPVRGPFPVWKPTALPQTKTNGPVTLTLEALDATESAFWKSVQPHWRLQAPDAAWARARARHVTFEDSTGNTGQWLSPSEPAWKAHTLVYRERREDFGPDERLVLTHLAIPEAGKFTAVDRSADCAGVRLSVLVLAGAGRLSVTNGLHRGMDPLSRGGGHSSSVSTGPSGITRIESWGSDVPFFLVEASGAEAHDEILFRLLDEAGEEIKLDETSGYNSQGGVRTYQRRIPQAGDEGGKPITLEVTVNRPLHFEFMIDPSEIRPAKRR